MSKLLPALLATLLATLLCAAAPVAPAAAQADVLRFSGQANAAELRCASDRSPLLPRATAATAVATGLPPASTRLLDSSFDGPGLADEPALPTANPRTFKLAVWGDSHTASGAFVDGLLEAYGLARERSLPSFIPPTFGLPGVRLPVQKACVSGGWQLRTAQRASPQAAAFGKALVALSADSAATPDATLAIDFRSPRPATRLRALDIHHSRDHAERTLVLGVSVDDGPERVVVVASASAGRPLRLQAVPALSTLRIRLIAGQVNLEGFAPVYEIAPSAIVDVFSVPGATANGWRAVDAQRLRDQAPQTYDLVLFQYGTNEAMADAFDADTYAHELRQNLAPFVKLNPRARCVLIGPPDRGAVVATMATTATTDRRAPPPPSAAPLRLALVHKQISDIQQRVGREQGCAFWNWQAAMGGIGAAPRWLARDPALMRPDLVHLSTKGYELSGHLFGQTLPLRPR